MSDLVLNALERNREIAVKAGQSERVERIDARLARLAQPERSTEEKKPAAVLDATEAASELADELGIDLADVEGSGEDGRILKGDVERAAEAATKPDEA